MASTKRKSDAPVAVASKRVRSHPTSSEAMSEEALNELAKDELVQHVLGLQQQLQMTIAAVPKATEYTPSKARRMLIKGISKQMKASLTQSQSSLPHILMLYSGLHRARRVKHASSTRATSRMNVSSKRCSACLTLTTRRCSK
jgi:hypothetical protein